MSRECVCGHAYELHVELLGHPDEIEECDGSEECDCGRFRSQPSALSRGIKRLPKADLSGGISPRRSDYDN